MIINWSRMKNVMIIIKHLMMDVLMVYFLVLKIVLIVNLEYVFSVIKLMVGINYNIILKNHKLAIFR